MANNNTTTTKPSAEELRDQLARAEAAESEARNLVERGLEDSLRDQVAPGMVIDEDGRPSPETAVASVDDSHPVWKDGPTFDLLGETWEARVPTQEGLMAFALATGKFIDPTMQSNFMGLFCREHLSNWSLSRMFERLLDHTDTAFNQEAVGELLKSIAELATVTE